MSEPCFVEDKEKENKINKENQDGNAQTSYFDENETLGLLLGESDRYLNCQEDLLPSLKKSFFSLSRAKQALWPRMISKDQIDLRPLEARVKVEISLDEKSGNFKFTPIRSVLKRQDNEEDGEEEEGDCEDDEQETKKTLRRRHQTQEQTVRKEEESEEQEKDQDQDQYKKQKDTRKKEKEIRDRNPIHQFAALPPPSLRQAQDDFVSSVYKAVTCVESITAMERYRSEMASKQSQK